MLSDFIAKRITAQLPFNPTSQQAEAIGLLGSFVTRMTDTAQRPCFLLKGYAGTGKSSVIGALTRALEQLQLRTVLMAPTGRAAKVIAAYSGYPAWTIHKRIYRQQKLGEERFSLAANLHKNTLFIVDEASMIANDPFANSAFGSGRLLDDLVRFVYSGEGCALLCLGDTAQLPPVGQSTSPALEPDIMAGYGLRVDTITLTQVARQALDSGILFNATRLREVLASTVPDFKPQPDFDFRPDFVRLPGNDFLETLEQSYATVGKEETIIVTRTNRRTQLYNQSVRTRILWFEDEVDTGDRIMVLKNNYFWTEQYEGIEFLANGDMMEVCRVRHTHEMYGFHFAEMSLRSLDYEWEIDALVWLDALHTDTPEELHQMQQQLFQRVEQDYLEIRNKRERIKAVMQNQYYNALQIKFAYCVTCHKAQGGQWKHVYIDPGLVRDEQLGPDFYRWFYTAITRASEQIFLL